MRALILDTETTGKVEPEPIEVAWLTVEIYRSEAGRLLASDMMCGRYKPNKKIELGAMATHHIFDEEVENEEPFNLAEVGPFDYMIGHLIDYDWGVVGKPDCKRICTDALSRRLYPGQDSYRLGAMAYLLMDRKAARELQKSAHAADTDVYLVYHILNSMLSGPLSHVDTWEELWLLSEDARIPIHMPFGKYRGEEIAKMPRDYKAWLLCQDNVDPYLREALQR